MHKGLYQSSWALSLSRRGLNEVTAMILEAMGPLAVLLAQVVYLGQPFLKNALPDEQWLSLITMLEDPQQRTDFIALLEERSN
jgi:hypothetical protein